jgi:hypothetical protein
VLLLVLLRLT